MKIALVHDYLIDYGGAERVLKALHEMYPEAPIYVSVLNKQGLGEFWKEFADADVRVSWFGKLPYAHRMISPLRFLLPWIWGGFDFSDYELVITSAAWAITKGMKKSKGTKEICYIHTPPRWLYGYDESRSWKNKWYGWAVKAYAAVIGHFLRIYDCNSAQRVDHFIANSQNVARRVEKFYRRNVDAVIHPPINVEKFKPLRVPPLKGGYYLAGGRMMASKNFDLIIIAFNRSGLPLKIYGTGLLREELEDLAEENVEFVGRVDDGELVELYRGAEAFIIAQKDEDFGMTPVEAMAAGTPVIAYRGGGYEESVIEEKTGVFFDELTAESLQQAVKHFDELIHRSIKNEDLLRQAERFSDERFKKEMLEFISEHA